MRQGFCTQRLEVSCGDTWCVKYSEEVKPEDHPFLLETQPSLAWPILGRKLCPVFGSNGHVHCPFGVTIWLGRWNSPMVSEQGVDTQTDAPSTRPLKFRDWSNNQDRPQRKGWVFYRKNRQAERSKKSQKMAQNHGLLWFQHRTTPCLCP